jgi:hypothetical protein
MGHPRKNMPRFLLDEVLFFGKAKIYSQNRNTYQLRAQARLAFKNISIYFWQKTYDEASLELQGFLA